MLACKHCSTPNSLDSTFCKKCGTAVPADARREALAQLDKLVEEGRVALAAGRPAEALAIADSAIATDPTHLAALHLKSAVHERRGEIADALESAERIVELNPDSELDRIKRNGLRASLLDASTPAQPDRRIAFVAAAATIVLVACVGILAARRPAAPLPVASNSVVNGAIVDDPVVTTPQRATEAPAVQPTAASVMPTQVPSAVGGTTGFARPPAVSGSSGLPQLPDATSGEIGPVIPSSPVATNAIPVTKSPASRSSIARREDDPAPTTLPTQTTPEEDPGTIEISVSRSGARRAGGGALMPDTRTNGSAAYARVGTERYELGDYAGAASNLEKAVQGGGNPVELNRLLAQAYSRLGRNSEAASAYERSRTAADAALASGRGDKERLQAARDAADAGLKTVKGG